MPSVAGAVLSSWSVEWPLVFGLSVLGLLYARGFRVLRRELPHRFGLGHPAAFFGGLIAVFGALASPLDAFAGLLLWVHMVQHLVLMVIAAPLLVLAAPSVVLLRGLPPTVFKHGLGPFLAAPRLQALGRGLTHPVTGFVLFVGMTWGWHAPAAYELALRSGGWHELEHASFLVASVCFWWPVVNPWPTRRAWPRLGMVPVLLLAAVQNSAFSALFVFSDRVLYPSYALAPRVSALGALDDQRAAGAIMWVPASLAFLLPIVALLAREFEPAAIQERRRAVAPRGRVQRARPPERDLTRRAVGAWFVASRAPRRVAQGVLFALAGAVVIDGLWGTPVSALNLAGVLPWTYLRGFAVVFLLLLGNAFCAVCPFTLPGELLRRVPRPRLTWPGRVGGKWPSVVLLVAFLMAYEALDLWDDPSATACLVLGYFGLAFAVDVTFRAGTFCKVLCPIGQYHFLSAASSPFEVKQRSAQVCAACTTHDCVNGRGDDPGCPTDLFIPTKAGSFDCTFCFDCARACPHDNVGLLPVIPADTLRRDPVRSSLRRLSQRLDVAVLGLVFTFGALVNAAGMVGPVHAVQMQVGRALGFGHHGAVVASVLLGVVLLPVPLVFAFAALTGSAAPGRLSERFARLSTALLPLGFSIWLAHFAFHLITAFGSLGPALARLGGDVTVTVGMTMGAPVGALGWLRPLELCCLGAGLALSAWVLIERVADGRERPPTLREWLPGVALSVLVYGAAAWVLLQPMEMRGMMNHVMA